jgi:hypothetical protein
VPDEPGLTRKLGTFDAVTIGLGSMIDAGIFAALAPAAGGLRARAYLWAWSAAWSVSRAFRHGAQNGQGVLRLQRPGPPQQRGEVTAADESHCDEQQTCRLAGSVDGHNLRVIE